MSDNDTILIEDGPPSKRLFVRLTEYKGTRTLDLRFWYQDKKTEEYRPSNKGISLTRKNYLTARDSFATKHEQIMDHLGVGYVPKGVTEYDVRQDAHGEEVKRSGGPFTVGHDAHAGRFFRVSHEGAVESILFSGDHPLDKTLERLGASGCAREDLDQLVGALLSAYTRAKTSVEGSSTSDASLLLDQLEHNWSEILAKTLSPKG